MFHAPEKYRMKFLSNNPMFSDSGNGNNGAFKVPGPTGPDLFCIASDGLGWEHVSVSLKNRCPNWLEMSAIKDMFWDPEDCVVKFHPPRSEYINNHDYCLHLWRPVKVKIPRPDSKLVGMKLSVEEAP